MTATEYTPPVSRLLTLGELEVGYDAFDYFALGLGPEHVSELARMMLDRDLMWAESDSVEVWAPTHALWALTQIRSPEIIEPVMALLARVEEDRADWVMEALPDVFAAIGPVSIPVLTAFLADESQGELAHMVCAECFEAMVRSHPAVRQECIDIHIRQLEQFESQSKTINSLIIGNLLTWGVVEAAPLIERAYAADRVDKWQVGDWEDAQIELGLLEERITPEPVFLPAASHTPRPARSSQQQRKAKRKRKQQKQTRRKQRKR